MRKWKCVEVGNRKEFTIGKIYKTDSKGNGIISDSGSNTWCNIFDFVMFDGVGAKFEEVPQFTKADLKPCMVVVRRDGSVCGIFQIKNGLKFQDNLAGGNCEEKHYYDDLTSTIDERFDIMKVFDLSDNFFSISTENRPLLFERIEKSPAQLKLEELENKQREIADEIKKVREEME